jgi:hypothetical protein
MAKLLKLKRADQCADCGAGLDVGTSAYWFGDERLTRCQSCYSTSSAAPSSLGPLATGTKSHDAPPPALVDSPAQVPMPLPPPPPPDLAGESAQREYHRRSTRERARKEATFAEDAAWRTRRKEERPVLGRIQAALTPKPQMTPESQSTRAWKIGAEGERRIAEALDGAVGIAVLHDRLMPGSRTANIDHVVIGPSGVFVIDAKKYEGTLEVRDIGTIFRPDERLFVADRNKTALVDGIRKQVGAVRLLLAADYGDIPVAGVLCFTGCVWTKLRTKHLDGVTVLWPAVLAAHVAAPGPLGDRVGPVATLLRRELRVSRASAPPPQ